MTFLFVFTATICILNLLAWVPAIFGNGYSMPGPIELLTPKSIYVLYPSVFYQVWFWTDKLNIIGN